MSTPFLLDDAAIAALATLKRRAEAEPVSREAMLAMIEAQRTGRPSPAQFNREQTITLPFGYEVTFTIEWQPAGMARHLSMTAPAKGKAPIPQACQMVMDHLGYRQPYAANFIWLEDLLNGEKAVNVVEIFEPSPLN